MKRVRLSPKNKKRVSGPVVSWRPGVPITIVKRGEQVSEIKWSTTGHTQFIPNEQIEEDDN